MLVVLTSNYLTRILSESVQYSCEAKEIYLTRDRRHDRHISLNYHSLLTAAITDLTLIGALVVTHAMLRRLINCRFLLLLLRQKHNAFGAALTAEAWYDNVYFVIVTEYSIQYIKSIYKMRKNEKKKNIKMYTKTQNKTVLTETTFYNIIKTIEHITFHITEYTDRALTDH